MLYFRVYTQISSSFTPFRCLTLSPAPSVLHLLHLSLARSIFGSTHPWLRPSSSHSFLDSACAQISQTSATRSPRSILHWLRCAILPWLRCAIPNSTTSSSPTNLGSIVSLASSHPLLGPSSARLGPSSVPFVVGSPPSLSL